MNQTVIFFVPAGALQRNFEKALREHFKPLPAEEASVPVISNQAVAAVDNDRMPLWTWFVPNGRPQAMP